MYQWVTSIHLQEKRADEIDIEVVDVNCFFLHNHQVKIATLIQARTPKNDTAISISSVLQPLDLLCLSHPIRLSPLIIQCLAWHGVKTMLHTPINTKNLFEENKCLLLPFLKFV